MDNLFYTTGFQTRFARISKRCSLARARRSLELVGLDLDPRTDVHHLTAAQRTGVAVARAMGLDEGSARVLVLDEPTATLPENEVEHLHGMLRTAASAGVGILYVTHHLDEVFRLARSVSVLRDGFLVQNGPVAGTTREEIVHSLVGSELEAVQREPRSERSDELSDEPVLSVTDLSAGVIDGMSFDAAAGEIVGIAGVTGSGREAVLGAVFGSIHRRSGEVRVAGVTLSNFDPSSATTAGVAYIPPDRKISGSFLHMTAAENLTIAQLRPLWKRGLLRRSSENTQALEWFDRLDVRPAGAVKQEFATFSGGNQQKIVFGKWFRTAPTVLLLDEPTQGVDVGAKAEIHRQIVAACERGMVVVVSSTDTEELATLCDRILLMAGGRVADEMTGGGFTDIEINRRFHGLATSEGIDHS
jgi:ribose transport system ATP-binding protein